MALEGQRVGFKPRRQIFIGDIQGCFDEFMDLLSLLQVDLAHDEVFLAGDMINRGPKSAEVLSYLMDHPQIHCILGNHEHFYIKGKKKKKSFTLLDEQFGSRRKEFRQWLKAQPYFIRRENWLLLHGGLWPGVEPEDMPLKELTTLRYLESGQPWYEAYTGELPIFFGHWALRGCVEYGVVRGLDSGCVYGGSLTAYVMPDEKWVSVPARGVHCVPK